MIATLIALALSAYLFYTGVQAPPFLIPLAMIFGAGLFSFGVAALLVSLLPLQKGEQNMTPRLFELYRKDSKIKWAALFLFCLPLIMIGFTFHSAPLIPLLIAIGAGIDVLYLLIRRIMEYINPFSVVTFMEKEAFSAIDRDADASLCSVIESCSEVAVKSVQRHNGALANHSIDALEKIGEQFLRTTKSLAHPIQNPELKAEGVPDSLSYVLLLLLQHLETIFRQSLDKKSEMVAGHVMTTLTKLAIYTTRIDLSLTSLPLFYVDKLSLEAIQRDFPDVGVKATIGLLAIADNIRNVKDIAYLDLKPSFITIISTLDSIAKETFKKDKSTKIALLTHPFRELAVLIDKDPIRGHQDQPVISDQLNHVLAEFAALEAVLATMPPLPSLSFEETKP